MPTSSKRLKCRIASSHSWTTRISALSLSGDSEEALCDSLLRASTNNSVNLVSKSIFNSARANAYAIHIAVPQFT
jgi:hypothetical protein